MRCLTCHAENREGVKFCEECGARLEMVCPACGTRLPGDRKFCGQCGSAVAAAPVANLRLAAPQAYTPAHLARRILQDRTAITGERKQVTVLFADVSGFTSISERLDPEDVHALINRAFELMLAEIHRYEGTVNQFLGDGVMALFGAPIAHEDHAPSAAHAALAIQRALADYHEEMQRTRDIDFQVRLGLNTGLVVVGAIGDNLRMDYTAVGDTTNTAARMQQLAEPGQVVVAEPMRRLIAPYFELRQLGTFAVKGRTGPVAAYALVRALGGVSRLAARVAHGRSPFVGRAEALATLERAWSSARAGRGQLVFVVGDPGIGKSRLLLEFRERAGRAATWIEGDCISFGQAIPFLPIVDMLKRSFGVEDHDAETDVVGRIERSLVFLGREAREVAPYVRFLLSVDPGDPAVTAMDPVQRRARIVSAILKMTAAGSRRRPIVLVVEDAHWMDTASEDLLRALAESLPGMAVLLVVTARPAYTPPFGDHSYAGRIPLQPVDEDDAVQIVRATLGIEDLPRDVAATIAAKAEGNPFFLEEIGRTLLESGAVRAEQGRLVSAAGAPMVVVPDTVQDVIAARIDRLDEPQKRTVQTAAVIGRQFALGLLRRVSDIHEQLERSLVELKRIELIYEKTGYADPEYVFRHALTQDVAYASLLQAERRRLHGEIGAAIEDVHAARLEEHIEELVHHFSRGEVWPKVVRYAREAAERAAGLCVDDRAADFYRLALDALARLPESAETARQGVEVRLAMRAPLWRGGRPEELHGLLREAEALATRHGLSAPLDAIHAFLVQYHWARGEHDQALEYGERCVARAGERNDLGLRITGLFYLCHAFGALGRHREAIEAAQEILTRLEGPLAAERFGLSGLPYSGACALAAESLAQLGDTAGALDFIRRGRAVADAAGHLYSQMVLAAAEGDVLVEAGRSEEAVRVLEPTVRTCREKNFVGQLINALHYLGQAYVRAGRPADAIEPVEESIALQERAKVYVRRGKKHTVLARAYLALDRLDEAAAEAARAVDFATRLGERGIEGWARLAAAEVAFRSGDRVAADAELEQAEEIAEELAMMPLVEECRAAGRRA